MALVVGRVGGWGGGGPRGGVREKSKQKAYNTQCSHFSWHGQKWQPDPAQAPLGQTAYQCGTAGIAPPGQVQAENQSRWAIEVLWLRDTIPSQPGSQICPQLLQDTSQQPLISLNL